MFSYNIHYYKAINRQISQSKRAQHALTTKSRGLLLPVDIMFDLFERMIVPILLYGSRVYRLSRQCIKN